MYLVSLVVGRVSPTIIIINADPHNTYKGVGLWIIRIYLSTFLLANLLTVLGNVLLLHPKNKFLIFRLRIWFFPGKTRPPEPLVVQRKEATEPGRNTEMSTLLDPLPTVSTHNLSSEGRDPPGQGWSEPVRVNEGPGREDGITVETP